MRFLIIFILIGLNSQAQWVAQNSGTSNSLFDVFFTDSATGWCVGQNGIVLSTQNSGNNWSVFAELNNDGMDVDLYGVRVLNDSLLLFAKSLTTSQFIIYKMDNVSGVMDTIYVNSGSFEFSCFPKVVNFQDKFVAAMGHSLIVLQGSEIIDSVSFTHPIVAQSGVDSLGNVKLLAQNSISNRQLFNYNVNSSSVSLIGDSLVFNSVYNNVLLANRAGSVTGGNYPGYMQYSKNGHDFKFVPQLDAGLYELKCGLNINDSLSYIGGFKTITTLKDSTVMGIDSLPFNGFINAIWVNTSNHFVVGDKGVIYVKDVIASTSQSIQKQPNLNLYPNPTHSWLYVNGLDERSAELQCYSTNGELMFIKNTRGNKIFVGDLPPGSYVLKLNGKVGFFLKK